MSKSRHYLKRSYRKIISSIAFYPTLMAIFSVGFAVFMLYFEFSALSGKIKNQIQVALVTNVENARLILGTIVGGIISLMVFSFSMVMVVLNRASEALSPRVIPGIISSKSHQLVLGTYISTIIYSLMLIINIDSERAKEVPSLGILFSMIAAITCLGLFVYFIDNISRAIQADNILNLVFRRTLKQLNFIQEQTKDITKDEIEAANWYPIHSKRYGYLNSLDSGIVIRCAKQQDVVIKVNVTKGFFIPKGYPFLSVNKENLDEEIINQILSHVELEPEEDIKEHFNFGFRQIGEIAVKALSPGINDPGTAQKAIDQLCILFAKRMQLPDYRVKRDNEGHVRVIFTEWSLGELLFRNLNGIREYGKNDILVMINLLSFVKNLMYADDEGKYAKQLTEQAISFIEDVARNNNNSTDLKRFNEAIENLNKISKKKFLKLDVRVLG